MMKEMFDLTDKVIIVFGGAGRIGTALTDALVESNSYVIPIDSNVEVISSRWAQHERVGNYAKSVDICSAEDINNLILWLDDTNIKVDAVINCAYPRNSKYGAEVFEVTYEDFCENLSFHLGGYFLVMQKFVQHAICKNHVLSFINFSSIYGSFAPRFDIYDGSNFTMPVEYSAIKAGVEQLTRYFTSYTKGSDVRVNCISPGGILDNQPGSFLEKYNSYSRRKGMLDVKDILGTTLFLCSDASKYICGQNIVVDDGFSLGGHNLAIGV